MDRTPARASSGKTLSSRRSAPLKPKSGLSGPPAVCYLCPRDRRPGALPSLIACGCWPAFNDLLRAPFPLGVPHPCVFCKGGRRCCRRNFCPFCTNPVAYAFVVPALRTGTRRTGHPPVLVMPARSKAWATRPLPAGFSFCYAGVELSYFPDDTCTGVISGRQLPVSCQHRQQLSHFYFSWKLACSAAFGFYGWRYHD